MFGMIGEFDLLVLLEEKNFLEMIWWMFDEIEFVVFVDLLFGSGLIGGGVVG